MNFLLSILLFSPSALAPQESGKEASRPNILLLVSEDNGPELGCYGDPSARTPRIDQLAAEGVRFDRAFVPYSVCSPSRAAFLTGLHPQQSGQIGLATHGFSMTDHFPSLPSLLSEAGYRTGIIGKLHVLPTSAFPFGFRKYGGSNFGNRRVREFAAAASEFFRDGEDPFFLAVNFPDAHFPLIARQDGLPEKPHRPDEVQTLPFVGTDSARLRSATADYYSCLARLDAAVGMVLDELDAAGHRDDTIVIYLGDHGAQFSRGKTSCYDAGLRIPLVVRWPGTTAEAVVRPELVSTLDLVPTICTAVGIPAPARTTGRPLQPLLRGDSVDDWREYVFAMGTGSAPVIGWLQFAVRSDRYKLILNSQAGEENLCARAYLEQHNAHFIAGTSKEEIKNAESRTQAAYETYLRPPAIELYDLEQDPHEFENLADDPKLARVRDSLIAELRSFRESIGDPFLDDRIRARFLAEQQAARSFPYRKTPKFKWSYLGDFRAYRSEGQRIRAPRIDERFVHGYTLASGSTVPVSGMAEPGERIQVVFHELKAATVADVDGRWQLELKTGQVDAAPRLLVVIGEHGSTQRLGVTVAEMAGN
jgi:N-sulfoglucosamine sulfohydrolase